LQNYIFGGIDLQSWTEINIKPTNIIKTSINPDDDDADDDSMPEKNEKQLEAV